METIPEMTNDIKRKRKKTIIIACVIISLIVYALVMHALRYDSSSDNTVNYGSESMQRPPLVVEFCNNTRFIFEDEKGNPVTGKVWVSINEERFEEITNISEMKMQKGLHYSLWIDSKDYYMSPFGFQAQCIDETDTQPFYVKPSVFKASKDSDMKLFDELGSYENGKIVMTTDSEGKYFGVMRIRYRPDLVGRFMPFGSLMVIEFPGFLSNFECHTLGANNFISRTSNPYFYVLDSTDNYFNTYEVEEKFDIAEYGFNDAQCTFGFNNIENVDKINGKKIKVVLLPRNFYITKTNKLILDVTKYADEAYNDYTSKSIVSSEATIEVKK